MPEGPRDQEAASDPAHDGPEASGTSQDEPGTTAESSGPAPDATADDPEPGPPADTNEGADARATIVEPGGEDLSPRA